jgi:DNA ligase-1
MLGKTFKGLTDAEFEEITNRLLALKVDQHRNVVVVKPQLVAEVEYDEIQQSPTYPSGMALRFARIKRLRYDKSPEETDTIQHVRELFALQFKRKAASNQSGRSVSRK